MAGESLVIVGTGGQAVVVRDIAELLGLQVVAYWSHDMRFSQIGGIRVVVEGSELLESDVVLALGDNRQRRDATGRIGPMLHDSSSRWIGSLIHPSAVVSASAVIGYGTVIHAGAIVGPAAVLGNQCIINSRAIVEHGCVLGDYASLAPAAVMGGGSQLGQGAFLGMNASLLQGRRLDDWSVVGASSLVLSDVEANSLVHGVPASFVQHIDDNFSPFAGP